MPPRLLLFEGAPGAGKSSLSQYVAQQLQARGQAVRWVEEHDLLDSWFAPFASALDADEAAGYVPALLGCWDHLAEQIAAGGETYVIDGAFFHCAGKMLLANHLPRARIEACYRELAALLAPLAPLVVHLTGDDERILRGELADRGAPWAAAVAADVAAYPYQRARGRTGVEGMVRFFVESQQVLRELLEAWPQRVLSIDTTARDWGAYQRVLLAALGLESPAPEQHETPEDLNQFVGVYQSPDFFPEEFRRPFSVEARGGELLLHMPFRRGFRLVPAGPAVFAIQGRPLRLEFLRDDSGRVTGAIYPFTPDQRFVCAKVG